MAKPSSKKTKAAKLQQMVETIGKSDLLELILHKPARERTVDPTLLDITPAPGVTVQVVLFASPTYNELARQDTSIRDYLKHVAEPLKLPLKRSAHLVAKEDHQEVETTLDTKLGKRQKLVDQLLREHKNLRSAFLAKFSEKNKDKARELFPSEEQLRHSLRVDKVWL